MKYRFEKAQDIHIFKEETNQALIQVEEQGEYVAIAAGHENEAIDRKLYSLDPVVWFNKEELKDFIEVLEEVIERMIAL